MAFPSSPVPNKIRNITHSKAKTGFIVETSYAEDGTSHSRLKNVSKLQAWELEYNHLDSTDCSTLDTYQGNQYGAYSTDTWTQPYTAETTTIRIKSWSKKLSLSTDRYTYIIQLEEQP